MEDNGFSCDRSYGLTRPIESHPCDSIALPEQMLEAVDTF